MECYVVCLFAAFSIALSSPPPSVTKHYRSDYEYNPRTNAFYKFHSEKRRGYACKSVCQAEGASLMVPASQDDIVQVHGMFKKYPDLGQYVFVAPDGQAHESAEENPIIDLSNHEEEARHSYMSNIECDVLTREGEIDTYNCFRELPFVCKVDAKDAPYDPHCDVFANGYQYIASVGSCYNVPRRLASWNEAYTACRAEGAHLVVLNSEAERAAVQALMQRTPKLEDAYTSWFFYAGFRANEPVVNGTLVFKTVLNQTLQEAGFNEWSPNEPNNDRGREFCGTIFSNDGKLNDLECNYQNPYICEKEVQSN